MEKENWSLLLIIKRFRSPRNITNRKLFHVHTMKKLLKYIKGKLENKKVQPILKRAELEKKVVEGAEKIAREYKRVFERLAEYDGA